MLMIERVARAIAKACGEPDWKTCLPTARVAVKAMSEPTPDMLDAALPGLPDWGCLAEDWRVMVHHVLEQDVRMMS